MDPGKQGIQQKPLFRSQAKEVAKRVQRKTKRQTYHRAGDEADHALAKPLLHSRTEDTIQRCSKKRQQNDPAQIGHQQRVLHSLPL